MVFKRNRMMDASFTSQKTPKLLLLYGGEILLPPIRVPTLKGEDVNLYSVVAFLEEENEKRKQIIMLTLICLDCVYLLLNDLT